MNAIAKIDDTPRAELIRVLRDSVWPGAKSESIDLAISYCRVNGLDPFLKPVHIVPMYDKGIGGMKDVLMPGIADYRIKAARSGEYGGKGEPEFGPTIETKLGGTLVSYPGWCRITITRVVAGKQCTFVAKEYWLENYATAKRDTMAPNAMWQKRPYGQLAKCTEAQALRMAFPEFSGGMPTAEEMDGETVDGQIIDVTADPVREQPRTEPSAPPALSEKVRQFIDGTKNQLAACEDPEEWIAMDVKTRGFRGKLSASNEAASTDLEDAFTEARVRLFPESREPGEEW